MAKAIKILHFSTHNEDCGIAKYQAQFIEGMQHLDDIENTYFELSPNQTKVMPRSDLLAAINKLISQMKDNDILHIQHEISFFKQDELQQIITRVHAMGKPIIVTVHAAPEVQYVRARRGGLGPRSFLAYARGKRAERAFLHRYIEPLQHADLLIVHNRATKENLVAHGLLADRIKVIRHPVQDVSFKLKTNEVTEHLRTGKQDVIYCTVGFLSEAKGVLQAVKALSFLPENYKLAILGGVHPDGAEKDEAFLNHVSDVIVSLGLKDRVYITGYIEDDERLNALIRECDICVYPYDRRYYAYVSSGALNLGLANHRMTIAYPTAALVETNDEIQAIKFCQSANYYELARELKTANIVHGEAVAKEYATMYSWRKEAVKFADIYRQTVR